MLGNFNDCCFLEERKRKLLEEFVEKIEDKYGLLTVIGYEYDFPSELHCIWHTNAELEYDNVEFKNFIGNLLMNLMENGIYNICFGYSYKEKENLDKTLESIHPHAIRNQKELEKAMQWWKENSKEDE